jgi:phosphoribosyl 1,2-cyclic phosphate phosphodiesterase
MKWVVLGSGTSNGIPMLSCSCPVCRSRNKYDKRFRASLYIKGNAGERIVVDTGPEFRLQALKADIDHLDMVLLTHSHADHLHGLDDVRPLTRENPLPLYANAMTLREVEARFSYIWENTQKGGGKPRIMPQAVNAACDVIDCGAIKITPLPVQHGSLEILGWKFLERGASCDAEQACFAAREAAYITDCSYIPDDSLALLNSISVLVIGALRVSPHPTHFCFDEALNLVKTIMQRGNHVLHSVYFTHISHEHSHSYITAYCKNYLRNSSIDHIAVLPAYDGLEIEI